MTVTALEHYYLKQRGPTRDCLLALRDLILRTNKGIIHERKFQIPFFSYRDRKLAYLWMDRKKLKLGFAEDKRIQQPVDGQVRKDRYESIVIDPMADLPLELILEKLKFAIRRIDLALDGWN